MLSSSIYANDVKSDIESNTPNGNIYIDPYGQEFSLGYQQSEEEFIEYSEKPKEDKLLRNIKLPESIDLSEDIYFPAIGDQGNIGSCAAFAPTYYQFTYQVARLNNNDAKHNPKYRYSPRWVYNSTNPSGDPSQGSIHRDVYRLLMESGCVTEAAFPYDGYNDNTENYRSWDLDAEHWYDALSYRISSYDFYTIVDDDFRVQSTPIKNNKASCLDNIKQLLAEGHVICCSTDTAQWRESYNTTGQAIIEKNYPRVRPIAGHMITIVGYDDNFEYDINRNGTIEEFEKGAFKIANSWGTQWGSDGYAWIIYDSLNKVSNVPNRNEIPLLNNNYIVINVQSYTPKLTAEITLTHSVRNQISIVLGSSALDKTIPERTKWYTGFSKSSGAFAFDGSNPTPQEITLVFDYSDLFIPDIDSRRWYISLIDNTNDQYPGYIKSWRLRDGNGNIIYEEAVSNGMVNGSELMLAYPSTDVKVRTADGVKIKEQELILRPGQTYQLQATITPEDTNNKMLWWNASSTKPNIINVDSNGLVTALSPGVAYASARIPNYYDTLYNYHEAEVKITVQGDPITNIHLDESEIILPMGSEYTITAHHQPSINTNGEIWYVSSDPGVVDIHLTQGDMIPVAPGTATITAMTPDETVKAYCTVTVPSNDIQELTLDYSSVTLNRYEELKLNAALTPDDVAEHLTWESSDPSVAVVSKDGYVTALYIGKTRITATALNGKQAFCDIEVPFVDAECIEISQTTANMIIGEQLNLRAYALPSNVTHNTILWTSWNEDIASVDNKGKVTAKKAGTATIRAYGFFDAAAVCTITVTGIGGESLQLNKDYMLLQKGDKEQLVATVFPEIASFKTVTWGSDDESVAVVDAAGNVTAVGYGVANISATLIAPGGMITASCKVEIARHLIENLSFEAVNDIIKPGQGLTLIPIISPTNAPNKVLKWYSSNPTVISVDQSGNITAKDVGTAYIFANSTDGSKTWASIRLTVEDKKIIPVTDIEINEGPQSLEVGESWVFTAKISPENYTTANKVKWFSSDTSIATIDNNGKVSALAEGITTITARITDSHDGDTFEIITVSAGVQVLVRPKNSIPITGIKIIEGKSTFYEGEQGIYTAEITPANYTASNKVTWISSNPSIATIDQLGNITAISTGTTTISASIVDNHNAGKRWFSGVVEITVMESRYELFFQLHCSIDAVSLNDEVFIYAVQAHTFTTPDKTNMFYITAVIPKGRTESVTTINGLSQGEYQIIQLGNNWRYRIDNAFNLIQSIKIDTRHSTPHVRYKNLLENEKWVSSQDKRVNSMGAP